MRRPNRRDLLRYGVLAGCWGAHSISARAADGSLPRLFFTSQGRTGLINADGSGLRYLELDVPGQATWQPGPVLPDGRHVVLLSMEPRRDGPDKPFEEYYHQTPTHLWLYDLDSGAIEELCARERIAPFYTPCLFLPGNRLLVQVVRRGGGQLYSMALDGTDACQVTHHSEGLPYGLSVSPDGRRLAFHLASPQGYQVWTSDLAGGDRRRVAAHPEHLYFGTAWSDDGQWLTYVDCHYRQDPGHDWADVCVGRPDGSEHRVLTRQQAMWFAATYGDAQRRGGGSNIPAWTADGGVLYPRRSAGARVPWQYQTSRPDVDHFNRDFLPDQARGGTQIVRIDPRDGNETELTPSRPQQWDFRACQSADGRYLAFCRASTGDVPGLYVQPADGTAARLLTRGVDDAGADHPRWITGA